MPRKEISFCPIEFKIRPILDSFRPKEFNMPSKEISFCPIEFKMQPILRSFP